MTDKMVVMTFHDVAPEKLEYIHGLFLDMQVENGRSANFNVIDTREDENVVRTVVYAGATAVGIADLEPRGEISINIDQSIYGRQLYEDVRDRIVIALNVQKQYNGVSSDG